MATMALEMLEERLQYRFNDRDLLLNALTHRSYRFEHSEAIHADNERLEFLGDAVLGLAIAHRLFVEPARLREGQLSRIRAAVVCEPTLAASARQLNLGAYLRLGKGEEQTGGRDKDSNLSNAMEALFAAVYLDGGFAPAVKMVNELLEDFYQVALAGDLIQDYKTKLQELVQAWPGEHFIHYAIVSSDGPVHEPVFTAEVSIDGVARGSGSGRSKKAAEQQAGKAAITQLQAERQATETT